MMNNRPTPDRVEDLDEDTADADDVNRTRRRSDRGDHFAARTHRIRAVMIAAGIVAKKAVEKGLKVPPYVKTSLAPGSRVVTEYLEKTGLQKYLERNRF